jgi:UDP-N-acetyl-2-amino-2-deoxyglucuronate dehydrogenase
MLGIGIVGCGMIARFHVRALNDIPGTRVAAVFDQIPAAAEKLQKEVQAQYNPACEIAPDLDSLVKHKNVDIVIITTPSGNHMEPAVAAANAGKHVVVEKPMEITLERCDNIINACDKNKVKLCTIFPSRFGDANRELKAAVTAGRFGRLTLGETTCKWWRTQEYYDQGGWRGTWALDGGGSLMNQAIHNVDLLLWMMGDVSQVMGFTSRLAHERIEVEDTAVACLVFKSGALGVIQATTSVWPGYPKTIAIHGDQGTAEIEQDDLVRWDFKTAKPDDDAIRQRFAQKVGASGGASDPSAISHVGHARQLTDFIEAIQKGTAPLVDGREGRKAVEVILSVYASNKSGQRVELKGS